VVATNANWLDRTIEKVFPSWGKGRYSARTQLATAREVDRMMGRGAGASARGAVQGRFGSPWGRVSSVRGGSPWDLQDLADMSDRAEDVYNENVIGGGLLDTETDNIVGLGFSLQMLTKDEAFNAYVERRFYKWLDKADVGGQSCGTDLFRDSWLEPRKNGDGGFLLIKQGLGSKPKLQYIHRDLIRDPLALPAGQTREEWRDGVRIDGAGAPIEYCIHDIDANGRETDKIVPARDFIFLTPKRMKKSVRGSTVYRRIFPQLDQADSLFDATTKSAIMAAIYGLIEKRKNPGKVIEGLGETTNAQGDTQKAVTLEGGMVKIIGTDESVMQVQATQPLPQLPEFARLLLRIICLAFDMPLEIGMRDLSQVNFSGGRIGLIAYYRSCRVKQDWLISMCWNRIVFWWLSIEKQRQQFKGQPGYEDVFEVPFPADYGEFQLNGHEWDYNDPSTEADADAKEIANGTQSVQGACEKKNRDYKKIRKERLQQLEADRRDRIPVTLPTTTRDETTKVTAIDADGNPLATGDSAPLNGIQISSALDILNKVTEKLTDPQTATTLLTKLNISEVLAKQMVNAATSRTGISAGDRTFQREMLKLLGSVPAAREAIYEATDMEDLMEQSGMPIEKGYEFPHIPLVAPAGQIVSGAVVRDPAGDIVGGDVVNDESADSPTLNGGTRNSDPGAATTDPPKEGKADE